MKNQHHWLVLVAMALLVIVVVYFSFNSGPRIESMDTTVTAQPQVGLVGQEGIPESPYYTVAKVDSSVFLSPTVSTSGSGTDAQLSMVSTQPTQLGFVSASHIAAPDRSNDIKLPNSNKTQGPAITSMYTPETLSTLIKQKYERENPDMTWTFLVGKVVSKTMVDIQYSVHKGLLSSVKDATIGTTGPAAGSDSVGQKPGRLDARRFIFGYDSEGRVVLKGDEGKNSGKSVLPTEILKQYTPEELWPMVERDYEYTHGVNISNPSTKRVSDTMVEYTFSDILNGTQTRMYKFSRDSSGGIIATDITIR